MFTISDREPHAPGSLERWSCANCNTPSLQIVDPAIQTSSATIANEPIHIDLTLDSDSEDEIGGIAVPSSSSVINDTEEDIPALPDRVRFEPYSPPLHLEGMNKSASAYLTSLFPQKSQINSPLFITTAQSPPNSLAQYRTLPPIFPRPLRDKKWHPSKGTSSNYTTAQVQGLGSWQTWP